ncbi:MAG TPA: hypothetical protein VGS57_14225 [Thermoanaerobaculia bacterium]|nr:hypothetical protein [Thermoanaerobaculia bacterium]
MSFADGMRRVWAVLTRPRQPLVPMLLGRRRLRRDLDAAAPTFAIALPILGATSANYDASALIGRLEAAGLRPDEATRCVALLPIAFGRAWLFNHGWRQFGDEVSLYPEGGAPVRLRLADQPLYRAGLHVALHAMHAGTLDERTVRAIAAMSAEVQATLPAVEAGEDGSGGSAAIGLGYDPAVFVRRRR